MNEEDQKKADEVEWSAGRIQCAAVRDVRLDAARNDIGAIDAAWSDYHDSCIAIDDRWDAARAKREAGEHMNNEMQKIWESLRAIYGSDLEAATVTVLVKDGETAVRFITTNFPLKEKNK
jgi:hypothetical protein